MLLFPWGGTPQGIALIAGSGSGSGTGPDTGATAGTSDVTVTGPGDTPAGAFAHLSEIDI